MTRTRLDPLTLYGILFIVFLYAPILLLPMFSFNDNTFAVFPLKGFTIRAYEQMVAERPLMNALKNSLIVASVVSVMSTVFGLLAAMAATRYRLPGRGPVLGLIMLPLVIPSIILAVALLIIIRQFLDLELTLWTVGAAHVLICVPFSMLVLVSRLEGFDRSLEEASQDLGENGWMTFWRVTFPLMLPGVVSSLLMAFTISFDEYVLAFFLSGIDQTLPIFLYSQLRFPSKLPLTLALGSSILIVSTLVVVVSELIRRRGSAQTI
ncbi:spermidine/putrescine transport system permease protein [Rhodoligotrophos appendicifer]|uniref:ABC transporter permease n=1 Tax=Rhodoligotrophos appendicifer TaxID=987056 RepID=UPI001185E9CE|nr:ABC transporter permease [Rhodoligotrophos appendicifer]